MATSARRSPGLLVDTSVAAVTVADHEHHEETLERLRGRRLGLAGHAAFETFSVLTRLPAPARTYARGGRADPGAELSAHEFLSAEASRTLLEQLDSLGISGGTVYDALVGATAAEHGLTLVSRDRRALETYRALEVRVEFWA